MVKADRGKVRRILCRPTKLSLVHLPTVDNAMRGPSEGNQNGFVTHYVESVKRGWPIRLPLEGKPVRDILHVDDFSRACQAFIDSSVAHGFV